MNRRRFLKSSALAAGALSLPSVRNWAYTLVDGTFTNIRRGVGAYANSGGTIGWMANEDGVVVIDTQFREQAAEFAVGLREKADRSIDLLLNTHHHRDHTSGNIVLVPEAGMSVAHENCRLWQEKSAKERGTESEQAYAETTFSESWSVSVGDEVVNARHYGQAHTSGDAVVHFEKADVVHMGDLVFNRFPCFVDRDSGATIFGWMKVLETVHSEYTDDTLFIFGHGGAEFGVTGKRPDLLIMRDFLNGLLEFARAGIDAGQTEDEVAATLRLPKFPNHYFAGWKNGVSNALRKAYQELTEDA